MGSCIEAIPVPGSRQRLFWSYRLIVARISGDYGATFLSKGVKAQLGYEPDQFTQDPGFWANHIHPGDQPRAIADLEKVFDNDQTVSEYRFLHADGSWRWMHDKMSLIRDEDGNPLHIVGSWLDITDRVDLERDIIDIAEHERNRVGRDLHDGLGQTLTGISLSLKALGTTLVGERSPHAETVQQLTAAVQITIAETRRVAELLSSRIPSGLSLGEALVELAKEVNDHANVKCHVQCPNNKRSHDPEVATHLYRIAQESVANALKHGNPQNIELRYQYEGKLIHLEVLDDGVGISAAERDGNKKGAGLRNIYSRARLVNGSVVIERRAEGGTRVFCSCLE